MRRDFTASWGSISGSTLTRWPLAMCSRTCTSPYLFSAAGPSTATSPPEPPGHDAVAGPGPSGAVVSVVASGETDIVGDAANEHEVAVWPFEPLEQRARWRDPDAAGNQRHLLARSRPLRCEHPVRPLGDDSGTGLDRAQPPGEVTEALGG